MRFGNDVRIDDFAVLSAGEGGIELGSYVHVAVFSLLIGKGRITVEDFSGLSSRVSIYSSSDDYTGKWMTNPTVPDEFTGAKHADVRLGRHVIIGANSVILPGTVLEEGAAGRAEPRARPLPGLHDVFRRAGAQDRHASEADARAGTGAAPAARSRRRLTWKMRSCCAA